MKNKKLSHSIDMKFDFSQEFYQLRCNYFWISCICFDELKIVENFNENTEKNPILVARKKKFDYILLLAKHLSIWFKATFDD